MLKGSLWEARLISFINFNLINNPKEGLTMNLWKLMLHAMLMLVLAVTLTACSGDDDDDNANDDDATTNDDDDTTVDDDDTTVDDDDTVCTLTCGENETLDEEACECVPNAEELDPNDLVGTTSAIVCLLDPDFDIVEPVGIGPILSGLVSCDDLPPIAFTVQSYDEATDTLQFIGGNLNADMTIPADQTILCMPPASFAGNPEFEIQVDGEIVLSIEGLDLTIFDLNITGVAQAAGGFNNGVLAGVIDPAPLADLLGGQNPCDMLAGVCNEEGLIPIRIENMVAVDVPGVVIDGVCE